MGSDPVFVVVPKKIVFKVFRHTKTWLSVDNYPQTFWVKDNINNYLVSFRT